MSWYLRDEFRWVRMNIVSKKRRLIGSKCPVYFGKLTADYVDWFEIQRTDLNIVWYHHRSLKPKLRANLVLICFVRSSSWCAHIFLLFAPVEITFLCLAPLLPGLSSR